MSDESSACTVGCGDCGLRTDLPGGDALDLLVPLRAFLAEHAECSYNVTLIIPQQGSEPVAGQVSNAG